jgi:hypothetical protein
MHHAEMSLRELTAEDFRNSCWSQAKEAIDKTDTSSTKSRIGLTRIGLERKLFYNSLADALVLV